MNVPIRKLTEPYLVTLASRAKDMLRVEQNYRQRLDHCQATRRSPAGVAPVTHENDMASKLSVATHARAAALMDLNEAMVLSGVLLGERVEIDGCLFRGMLMTLPAIMIGPDRHEDDDVPEVARMALDAALGEPELSDREQLRDDNRDYYDAVGVRGAL